MINSLIQQGAGDSLPMNLGAKKWIVLDTLLEPFWIKQNKVEFTISKSNSIEIRSLQKGFLYPIKPDYIQKFKLSLNDLEIKDGIKKSPLNAQAEIRWKNKRKVNLNKQFIIDTRSIAIWPPFKSKYFPNYVIEYDLEGIDKPEKLEFYDENGRLINYVGLKHHSGQNFRIYKFSNFPKYIRILMRDNGGSLGGGFVEIQKRNIGVQQGKVIIGIDFGTSHTTVAYRKDNNDSLIMDFQKSKPIVIVDAQSDTGLLYNFLPPGLRNDKPQTYNEWQTSIPWQPIQTQWQDFSNNQQNMNFIEDGNIPFLYYKENIQNNNRYTIKENLKCGVE